MGEGDGRKGNDGGGDDGEGNDRGGSDGGGDRYLSNHTLTWASQPLYPEHRNGTQFAGIPIDLADGIMDYNRSSVLMFPAQPPQSSYF